MSAADIGIGRILLVHNFYGSAAPSGENAAYEAELRLLRSCGHEIAEFTRHSDDIRDAGVLGELRGGLATPWNPWMARHIARITAQFRPDVVHVHNTFPLISPAIFYAVGPRAARVLTLHNYRLFCAAGVPMRDDHVCTECLDRRSALPSIRHGCYRNSRLATLPLAISVELHRRIGTWTENVDAFISLSNFQRERMAKAGLPVARTYVKPNFCPDAPEAIEWRMRDDHVVYVGRLSAEKGVRSLVRAWLSWGLDAPRLKLIGDGPLSQPLRRMASDHSHARIEFVGQVAPSMAKAEIARARMLIVPSECFEGFPMVVADAFASGTPVAASRIGPLPELVGNGTSGTLFEAGDPASILREVRRVWHAPGELERLSRGARSAYERSYTALTNYRILVGIYEEAIKHRRARRSSVAPRN